MAESHRDFCSKMLITTNIVCLLFVPIIQAFNGATSQDQPADAIETYNYEVAKWLKEFNDELQVLLHKHEVTAWNYMTNLTDRNAKAHEQLSVQFNRWYVAKKEEAKTINPDIISDEAMWMLYLITRGVHVKDENMAREIAKLQSDMKKVYGSARVCLSEDLHDCHVVEPDLAGMMETSRDYDKLLNLWKSWRDAVGPPLRELWVKLARLLNIVAQENGYLDQGDYQRRNYDIPDFRGYVQHRWEQLKPLYLQLHAYVRHKLGEFYGYDKVPQSGPIPAHILGNMWAQEWTDLYDLVAPFPQALLPNVTTQLLEKNFDVHKMFKTAEEFFVSLGLNPMTEEFWNNSMLEKPANREVICHGSAFTMHDKEQKDFRIKMCTEVKASDFITVHHEMGHVEYYMQYSDLPQIYQEGANKAFHEAVGDTITLSASTPQHLKAINLAPEDCDPNNEELQMNFLMLQALRTVAFLPFGLLIDLYRWDIYSGNVPETELNSHWWKLRLYYQGVAPPVSRSEKDFDPGSKYHIAANSAYISYFLSFQLEYQFHKALCRAAGHTGSLHTCDIYQSKTAGEMFRKGLSMGHATPWPNVLQVITGEVDMKPDAMLEYFAPLYQWLQDTNARNGVSIGWEAIQNLM